MRGRAQWLNLQMPWENICKFRAAADGSTIHVYLYSQRVREEEGAGAGERESEH